MTRATRKSVATRARAVRLLVLDVDGVLTDGRMSMADDGREVKAFHTRDGIAFDVARRAGLELAMVTGERSTIAKARGEKLGVTSVVVGARRKGDIVESLAAEHGLELSALAYIGDDLLDIPALQRVGLAVAVADAAAEVKAVAHVVTRTRGGHGAVRECVELILRAQRTWTSTVAAFVAEHGGMVTPPGRRDRRSAGSRRERDADA